MTSRIVETSVDGKQIQLSCDQQQVCRCIYPRQLITSECADYSRGIFPFQLVVGLCRDMITVRR